MKTSGDQPKRVLSRKIIDHQNGVSLELVEFSAAVGTCFGCRAFTDNDSVITDSLYTRKAEAIEAGWQAWSERVVELDRFWFDATRNQRVASGIYDE